MCTTQRLPSCDVSSEAFSQFQNVSLPCTNHDYTTGKAWKPRLLPPNITSLIRTYLSGKLTNQDTRPGLYGTETQKHVFITSEIDKARQKLSVDFLRAQFESLTATSQLSMQETEEGRESLRTEEERKAQCRSMF